MRPFENEVAAARQWFESPRFAGIVRLYTARQVVEQRGTIASDHTVAREAAAAFHDRMRQLFAERKCITTFGPYSPGQAVAMKRMGIEGIYLGGWATSAKGGTSEDPRTRDPILPAIHSARCPTRRRRSCAPCSRRIATSTMCVCG